MKHLHFFALLIAVTMMAMCPHRMWAYDEPSTTVIEGKTYYQIGTTSELFWLLSQVGQYVNETNPAEYNAVLTADITINENVLKADGTLNDYTIPWTMPPYYYGTFDGQGHTISGIYLADSGNDGTGMFRVNYGTIRNLGVKDSYFGSYDSPYNVGTFAGYNYGTITDCYSFATINALGYSGGIAGCSDIDEISNCFYAGKMIYENYYVPTSSPICSDYDGDDMTSTSVHNNYFLESCLLGSMRNVRSTSVTSAEMASGKVAYLLQADRTDLVWGQDLTSDSYPVLGGARVYGSHLNCAGQVYADATYSNDPTTQTRDEHVSDADHTHAGVDATCTTDGTIAYKECTVCGQYYDEDGNTVTDLVIPGGHNYVNGVCTRCGKTLTVISEIGKTRNYSRDAVYYNYYKNSTTFTIYKGSEIGNSGWIKGIAYNVRQTSENGFKTNEVKVYMMMTDLTNLDAYSSLSPSDFTLVYSGNPTLGTATGWEKLILDTPFEYDNTKNLIIAVCRKSDNYDRDLTYYYTYDSGVTRMFAYKNDRDATYCELDNLQNAISNGAIYTDSYYSDIQIDFRPSVSNYELADGITYTNSVKAATLTYKRTFAKATYSALYVPFAMQYSDWSDKADVYRLLNVFENDNDNDGNIDEWVLKVVKLREGESTKANTPYVIKPKAAGDMTLTISDVITAHPEEKSYWCASLDNKFIFTGSYVEKDIAADSYFFVSTNGGLQYTSSDVSLKPQRWYMGIYDKDTDALIAPSTFNPLASPAKAIRIFCDDDEDVATGIHEVSSAEGQQKVFSISGQRLSAPVKGINIINGKKVLVK